MKMILVMSAVILFAASSIFAAPFAPTLLKFSASPQITYKFDGTQLQIPVTVTGKPSNTIFMIYTKDQATNIGKLRNGLLGWHYMNRVDTCLYMSPPIKMSTGTNTVTWDGKDTYGTKVPTGAYTYYLWGFDNLSPKEQAIKAVNISSWVGTEGRDIKGVPLANPIFYIGLRKWTIGVDPETAKASFETTTASRSGIATKYGTTIALDPLDHGKFWQGERSTGGTMYVTKYKWTPNAAATLETTWGDNGTYTWDTVSTAELGACAGVVSDGKGLVFNS